MFAKILYRPELAIVISIVPLFLGVLGIFSLPIAQFPDIAPPTVRVGISYPGASANALVDAVLVPLDHAINGVQSMRYRISAATSASETAFTIFIEPDTDPDVNPVNVLNRLNTVTAKKFSPCSATGRATATCLPMTKKRQMLNKPYDP